MLWGVNYTLKAWGGGGKAVRKLKKKRKSFEQHRAGGRGGEVRGDSMLRGVTSWVQALIEANTQRVRMRLGGGGGEQQLGGLELGKRRTRGGGNGPLGQAGWA